MTQMQEKKARADYTKDKGKTKYDELMAIKQRLLAEMGEKQEKLHSLVSDSKELQNKAIKVSKVIRSDKDAYLKLGLLQTASTKAQVSLKGWSPPEIGQN